MNTNKKLTLDAVIHGVILFSTLFAVGQYFGGKVDALGSSGTTCFKYFTTDSNILMALASAVMLFFDIQKLKDPQKNIPRWAEIFRFAGTVAVSLTFVVVVIFLAPRALLTQGAQRAAGLFTGNVFPLHVSTPLLAIFSWIFLDECRDLTFPESLWALVPVAVYGAVYFWLVIAVRVWVDWYGFTLGGHFELAPVSILLILAVTLGITVLLRKLKK